jgi:putative ABC transport system substrate-binding protein
MTATRRQLIGVLAGALTVRPLAGHAQQSAAPTIGYLGALSPDAIAHLLQVLRKGLTSGGYVERRNVAIEYRWAEGQYDRLPTLATELLRRQVAIIVASPTIAALAAKAATATVPIVFAVSDDPVKLGLVESFARPGGNATGVYGFIAETGIKRLGLLHELVPAATRIGLLINPDNANAEDQVREFRAAATAIQVEIEIVQARDTRGIDAAFVTLARKKAGALVVGVDPFLFSRRVQLAILATRHAMPAVYGTRENAEAGGLMSYGISLRESFQQLGTYTVRILNGDKPADLPVVQSTKFELVVNLPTARALGLEIPSSLLARADEVIE